MSEKPLHGTMNTFSRYLRGFSKFNSQVVIAIFRLCTIVDAMKTQHSPFTMPMLARTIQIRKYLCVLN